MLRKVAHGGLREKAVFKVTAMFGSGLDDWPKEAPFHEMGMAWQWDWWDAEKNMELEGLVGHRYRCLRGRWLVVCLGSQKL